MRPGAGPPDGEKSLTRLFDIIDIVAASPRGLSGKEIAGLSGFFSPQHFCTEFQKYYGMTPGNYRRMFKR